MNISPRVLVFHTSIAPYRIDFFNELYNRFQARICMRRKNLLSQTFDYAIIERQLVFSPIYPSRHHVREYWSQLNEYEPDVVITSEFGSSTLTTLFHKLVHRKKYKVVTICDDSYNMIVEKNEFSWKHRWARKIISPFLNDIILVEPRTVAWYQQHYKKGFFFPIIHDDKKLRTVYDRLHEKAKATTIQYRLNRKRVFLFVGRLVALKNIERIIQAFSHLNQNDCRLVIIGDGPERTNLQQAAQSFNANVLFLGRLENNDLYQWYIIADCLVLASYQEAFGAVTNEALVAGCWCLISDKTGSSCLIENGINGFTFNPMNVDELSDKMKMTLRKLQDTPVGKSHCNRMTITFNERISAFTKHLHALSNSDR